MRTRELLASMVGSIGRAVPKKGLMTLINETTSIALSILMMYTEVGRPDAQLT
jgi:hypothetical protein